MSLKIRYGLKVLKNAVGRGGDGGYCVGLKGGGVCLGISWSVCVFEEAVNLLSLFVSHL